ncbi:hypothetical protein O3G_MSEX008010 [Manduca sexta]|uniref:RNA-directed DNA polymerase n=1 Tax=Manduca sexta TaxID=7130 RepID=A0A921ZAH6_MANSE|nr:hypothetical protein O3G_MSEX008010 [Manduca sexta]
MDDHVAHGVSRYVEDKATYVNFVVDSSLPVTLQRLREETQKDVILSKVVKYILNGWPKKVTDENIRKFFLCRDQLSFENGVIMRAFKVVIPNVLQASLLSELHKSHLGIVKSKAEARSRLWFPGIDKAIESMIAGCEICTQLRPSPARAPLAVWPHPLQPFYRVHVDFLGPINGELFFVIVDAHSKWVEVYRVNYTSSATVIAKLYDFMSRFGLIHTLVSDNATCFVSEEFTKFCLANGISHVTSPAYHPASNGQAESYVKIIKKGISCLLSSSNLKERYEKLLKYLFDYRNSVHSTTGSSPAQLVFGRKLRSRLDLINPISPPSPSESLTKFVKRQQCSQSRAYGGSNRQSFKAGDVVMYKKYQGNKQFTWNRGIVTTDCTTLVQVKKHKNQLIGKSLPPISNTGDVLDFTPELYETNTSPREDQAIVSQSCTREGDGDNEVALVEAPAGEMKWH